MVNFVIALECFGIALICIALLSLLSGEGAREQKLLIIIMCSCLVQNVGYLLELTAPTLEAAMTAIIIENVGSVFVPLCYCWFTYIYCYAAPPKTLLRILGAVSFFALPSVFFNWHGLFYRDVQWMSTADGFHYVSISYGPLYMVFMFSRIIIPYILCIHTLIQAVRVRSDKQVNRQYQTVLAISALPVLMLGVYVLKLVKVFDFTPMTLGVSMAMVVIVVWGRRNYDFRHLAADKVLESLGDGVIALDDHDRLVSYNSAAANIFTSLPSHRLGENVRVLEDFREDIFEEDTVRSFTIDGRDYESHSKRIEDENGKRQGCVVLMLDMTDTKAYIEEIKQVRLEAEKANIAKSEFLANMSHEIRTPMNAIIGLNDIIMEECGDGRIYAHARDVQSAAKNLLSIINDILDLSKVEAGKMELVCTEYHIKAMADEIVSMMDMAASRRGLILKYECDKSIPCRYCGDEGRIKQILINILNNAVKFTNRGYVRCSITGEPGRNGEEEMITFRVEDTGCGIKREDLGKIFENFRQVDSRRNRSVEGTGLGLAIVKHLVELMEGSIDMDSTYGVGTVVTITIPQKIADARPISEVPDVPRSERERMNNTFTAPDVKVLIVDDNLINRRVARGFLKNYGFNLTEAESGPQAIEFVREVRYDMIFMDHMMPGMDGIEAAKIIQRDCGENGKSPVMIALTANVMEGMREQFLENGFQDFIAKPLDRRELNRLLLRWIPEERRRVGEKAEDSALDPGEFQIEGVDMNAAVQHFSGSAESFAELLELYCLDGKGKAAFLRKLAGEDLSRFQIEVHGLKSASAHIGATEVSAMARAQERAAMQGDGEFIAGELPHMLAAYDSLLANIEEFLRLKKTDSQAEKLPELSAQELRERTASALEALEHFRSGECAEQVDTMLRHELSEETEKRLTHIRERLKLFEDDDAEELLRKLLVILKEEEENK